MFWGTWSTTSEFLIYRLRSGCSSALGDAAQQLLQECLLAPASTSLELSKWREKLTPGQLLSLSWLKPLFSLQSHLRSCDLVRLSPWPLQILPFCKLLLPAQPAPAIRNVKPSPHLTPTRRAHEDSKWCTSETAVQLLLWRRLAGRISSAWAKEIEDFCPCKCSPIFGLIWLRERKKFQVRFLCIVTRSYKPAGSLYFQNFAQFSNELISWTIQSSFEQFGPTDFILAQWKKQNGPFISLQ